MKPVPTIGKGLLLASSVLTPLTSGVGTSVALSNIVDVFVGIGVFVGISVGVLAGRGVDVGLGVEVGVGRGVLVGLTT